MVWRVATKSWVTAQLEQTTRRRPGFTGTGMSVRGLPIRYCSGSAPQASLEPSACGGDTTGGGGGGGASATGGGGAGDGWAGSLQPPTIAIRPAAAQTATPRLRLPCAIPPTPLAASTRLQRRKP